MITTGSVYDRQAPRDVFRILVMRHWPRGIRKSEIKLWLRDLGPSSGLLKAYQKGQIVWEEFAERYGAEVSLRAELLSQVKELEHIHRKVTLLCWERIPPEKFCHRLVLKELLDQMSPASG